MDAVILVDAEQPTYVQYAVQELAAYLKEITGREPPVTTTFDGVAGTVVVVGSGVAARLISAELSVEELGVDGYRLKTLTRDRTTYVVVAGATPKGTKYAVGNLMKRIRAVGTEPLVEGPLDLASRPAFAKRGMHFNGWPFNYPYSFRRWKEEDWNRFVDILAYDGANLFYLWPFIEIMPVPLSEEDEAYLQECRRVIGYAQERHGMEVWIMQCTNRVAKDDCGVIDPKARPYWRPSQEDLDPANPEHLGRIVASREAMYRILDNADGVCNIDSDPGYLAGSPLKDYLSVLQACRAELDEHNLHGKEAKLVNWMWCGWGLRHERYFDPDHQKATIDLLRQGLSEPWWLVNGRFEFLPVCRQAGVLNKTVLLPYGVIEGEPSYPSTNVGIDGIRTAFEKMAACPELAGVMGNVQTPLLQLPHVHYFLSSAWDIDYSRQSEEQVLLDVAGCLYPEHAECVAGAYLALKGTDPDAIWAQADRLDSLVQQDSLGRSGVIGRKLFPDHRIVAQLLVLQLRLRAAQERLGQMLPRAADQEQCSQLVRDYFDAYLAWDTAHGWHALWGWAAWPLGGFTADGRFPAVAARLHQVIGPPSEVDAFFDSIERPLASKYGELAVREGCVGPLKRATLAAAPVVSLANGQPPQHRSSPTRLAIPPAPPTTVCSAPYTGQAPWWQTTQSGCN